MSNIPHIIFKCGATFIQNVFFPTNIFYFCSELIESVMYLYRATGDSYLLEIGEDMLRSIQHSAKTSCGFATVHAN